MFWQSAKQQQASPVGTEYFLGIWPTGKQDLAAGRIVKPYDGPDAKLVQAELLLTSLVSGYVAYDFSNPYGMMGPSFPIGLPEDYKPGIAQPYDIAQSPDSMAANIQRFTDLLR